MVGSKHPTPVWLSPEEAEAHCIAGASVWKWASIDGGVDPDVVLVGIGVEMTQEVLAATALLRKKCPELRVRVVNVTDLMILAKHTEHPHGLSEEAFESLFTKDRHVHFNYVRALPSPLLTHMLTRMRFSTATQSNSRASSSTVPTSIASPSRATTKKAPPPLPST
jgi:xylulose-5-phosphate/fructose-6-phosphate phosphoketolase